VKLAGGAEVASKKESEDLRSVGSRRVEQASIHRRDLQHAAAVASEDCNEAPPFMEEESEKAECRIQRKKPRTPVSSIDAWTWTITSTLSSCKVRLSFARLTIEVALHRARTRVQRSAISRSLIGVEHEVIVVAHHCVRADLDREDRRELCEAIDHPLFAM